ncbi:amidohydrolase family protein [Engelhardtia mirabilis]|uniref:Amidohydrolase-related domain-containing protein n=1 Tax=Engelhardtia mirabilis TaxID=2528011 RepID=A0A518BDJ3_9BACT|nr:hypothetical protein Pla133_01220 [Planctomycetes bacterium Pla133]QDU99385.1 hypothetical protein Pla86_01220 [Planctomycetes bacterium Pla86]
MILSTVTIGSLAWLAPPAAEPVPDLLALRVGRAETISQGTIENAVILIDGGQIVIVGEDLPIERGIPIIDLPDAVVMPGFVNCRSRLGLDSRAGTVSDPEVRVSDEIYPRTSDWTDVLEYGVTTIGLYPPGRGIAGLAAAIRPKGDSVDELLLADDCYLTMYIGADRSAKKLVRDAFEEVDKYMEKVEKAREKWQKDQDKKKKDDEKEAFEPPVPEPEVLPMLKLRTQELRAQFSISKAADYLHLLDVLESEADVLYDIQIDLRDDLDLFYISDQLGEAHTRVICDPEIIDHPGTRRARNLPAELHAAGAKVAFIPRSDSVTGNRDWLEDVAHMVAYGLDRQVALRAMTLEPAEALNVGALVGSIEAGKAANLLIFDGDPFEAQTELTAVMLEGEIVHGELDQ